jgi:hypothetical protein
VDDDRDEVGPFVAVQEVVQRDLLDVRLGDGERARDLGRGEAEVRCDVVELVVVPVSVNDVVTGDVLAGLRISMHCYRLLVLRIDMFIGCQNRSSVSSYRHRY